MNKKELLAQALRDYPTWGDAYIAVHQKNVKLRMALREIADGDTTRSTFEHARRIARAALSEGEG